MTRSPAKADDLRHLGAEPVVCDVFDLDMLRSEVAAASPEAIFHLLTDLPDDVSAIEASSAANARIRREGTANLLTSARVAGTTRFIAESVAWELPGDAGRAIAELERAVLHVGGVVLRYGQLYGPGTYHELEPPPAPRVQVDEAARRTAAALRRAIWRDRGRRSDLRPAGPILRRPAYSSAWSSRSAAQVRSMMSIVSATDRPFSSAAAFTSSYRSWCSPISRWACMHPHVKHMAAPSFLGLLRSCPEQARHTHLDGPWARLETFQAARRDPAWAPRPRRVSIGRLSGRCPAARPSGTSRCARSRTWRSA